jgi:hypothetical protein
VNHRELALVQGWSETRATLVAWNRTPFSIVPAWLGLSAAIAALLLVCVGVVGYVVEPDPTRLALPGIYAPADMGDVWAIFGRNLLVLALHSMACLAGYIAKSSLPREAQAYSGRWRAIHDVAGPAAIAFVGCATVFSLATQSYALGGRLSTLSWQMDVAPAELLLALTPHAVPELMALFLPLAAWLIAARARAWDQLLAATIATTAIALPVVLAAAAVEAFVTPEILRQLHFV